MRAGTVFLLAIVAGCFVGNAVAIAGLEITPVDNFESSGAPGGPFTPSSKDYQLTNNGPDLLWWGADKSAGWLAINPDWGALDPNESVIVRLSLTAEANSLPEGPYTDTVMFMDFTNNINHTRQATLTVAVPGGIWVSPESFDVNVMEECNSTEVLAIGNDGSQSLDFTIRTRVVSGSGGSAGTDGGSSAAAKIEVSFVPKTKNFTIIGNKPHKPGQLIVRFANKADGKPRSRAEKDQILNSLGAGAVKREFKIVPGLSVVKMPPGLTVEKALEKLNKANGILYAEPDYQVKALSTFPNDTSFGSLWGMHNTGQSGGTVDADIDAPEAWDISTGSSDIIVAVIDTGVDYTHSDLAANMWVNQLEFSGTPGVDDDGNGFVDDIYGYDFCNNDGNPMDDHYHGTHCAGTIGAVGNNGTGVAGVCWNVKIMALKFLDSSGSGYTSDAIESVQYSVLMGANVSSNSWGGGGGYNQGLKDAIDAAGAAGMLFVAAAGNDNSNNDTIPFYPSNYTSPSLIAVMATDRNDNKSSFSNYGLVSVDLGAPGSSILSCKPGNQYQYLNGTSMAAPHVAGACALLWSMNPTLSNSGVKDILLRTVDKTLSGKCVSQGRLNLYNAVLEVKAPWIHIEPDEGTIGPGESHNINVTFDAAGLAPGTYEAEIIIASNDPYHPTKVVPVTMLVKADNLVVTPAEGFESGGTKGGPFAPGCKTYTVTNNGTTVLNWTTIVTADWFGVIPPEGVLGPSESIEVDVCVLPDANLLEPNTYTDTLVFQNTDTGCSKTRAVSLTINPPDCFTESLDAGGNDIGNLALTFVPDGSVGYYTACREETDGFPTDPNGGTYIPLGDDDFTQVVLSGGAEVLFYGHRYDRFYVGSNGYITFGDGDTEYSGTLEAHFNMPRISGLFADLAPSDSCNISYKQLADRVVVTFKDVPLYGDKTAKNSFQIEMFFADGAICVTWLDIAAADGVVGLSEGNGLPALFVESDMTGYALCWPLGDFDRDYIVDMNDLSIFTSHWLDQDCNIPYWCGKADLNFSGSVDFVDFAAFADNWLIGSIGPNEPNLPTPISHWKLDEGSGTIAHDSVGTNDGTIYGATWSTGQIGGALSFDGVNDYVQVSDSPFDFGATTDFSICAWVKTTNSSRKRIVDKLKVSRYPYEGFELLVDSGRAEIRVSDTSYNTTYCNATTTISDGQWHFITVVADRDDNLELYTNGVREAFKPLSAVGNIDNNLALAIGRSMDYNGQYFNGLIDDVRIYKRVLSASEIQQLYQEGSN